MSGITNHDIGHDAEKRIAARLTAMGAQDVRLSTTPHGSPDLSFLLNGVRFLAECKSVLGVHSGGRMGVAKVSSTEMQTMDSLSCDGSHICWKCLIVEVRPKTHSRAPHYLWMHWDLVREIYARRRPAVMSLTFWWLLKNGTPLEQIRRWHI